MKFKLENQDGVYFLDVYYIDTLKRKTYYSYGTIVFDTKRKTYYLIPSKKSDAADTFIEFMEKLFITNLVPKNDYGYPKYNSGSRTGELSYNVKEKLIDLFKLYSIDVDMDIDTVVDIPNLSESNSDNRYYKLLKQYDKGHYPESKMYNIR